MSCILCNTYIMIRLIRDMEWCRYCGNKGEDTDGLFTAAQSEPRTNPSQNTDNPADHATKKTQNTSTWITWITWITWHQKLKKTNEIPKSPRSVIPVHTRARGSSLQILLCHVLGDVISALDSKTTRFTTVMTHMTHNDCHVTKYVL